MLCCSDSFPTGFVIQQASTYFSDPRHFGVSAAERGSSARFHFRFETNTLLEQNRTLAEIRCFNLFSQATEDRL
jgi:hypothetical protein